MDAGTQVQHRHSLETGVVLAARGDHLQVSFASGIRLVSADDLVAVAGDDLDRAAAGQFGDSTAAHLRLLARLLQHSYVFDPGAGLSNARLEPQLHQAFVAHRVVARKVVPRMILADEVGLGKTIEAGLIIKELRARGLAQRVLIVTPASLTRQWQTEMSSKFNETFELMDGDAAKHFGRGGANPFLRSDSVIASLPFVTQTKRQAQVADAGWDLVVFDEAHRVRRTRARATQAYRLAEELRDLVHGLLLLTATPVQLDAMELYSLIDLVEPGVFASYQSFDRDRRQIPTLNQLMLSLERWSAFDANARVAAFQESGTILDDLGVTSPNELDDDDLRERLKDELIAKHPMAHVMVRNRKANLGIRAQRRAKVIRVAMTDYEAELYEDVSEYIRSMYQLVGDGRNAVGFLMVTYQKMLTSSSNALRTSFRRRVKRLQAERVNLSKKVRLATDEELQDPEEASTALIGVEAAIADMGSIDLEVATLTDLADRLDDVRDSKARRLLELLDEIHREEDPKAVVFTQFIETQSFLAATLRQNGYDVTVFNGQMKAEEKEDAIRDFRERAQVLVSTEAGGEGRNLQFASVLINFDLPWNPMKVEQRIGRLDRIGQKHPVDIYNLVYEGTLEERIVDVLKNRIRIFEESVGSLDPILGDLEQDFQRLAFEITPGDLDREFDRFSSDLGRRVEEARLLERTMADFVLDRASFRRDQARELLEQPSLADSADLERTITRGLHYLGGSVAPHVSGGEQLTFSPRLATRLGAQQRVIHGVFDPGVALVKDDLDFLACGHPVIDKILDALVSLPDADVGLRRSKATPSGLSLEVIWKLSASLVVPEARLVRHVCSQDGVLTSQPLTELPHDDEPAEFGVDTSWISEAARTSRAAFDNEYAAYRQEMRLRHDEVKQQKAERMKRVFLSQRERLRARIEEEQAWIAAAQAKGEARDLKILPARRGRLAKAEERLQSLVAQYDSDREALESSKPDIRGEAFSVSILQGT